MTRLFDGVVISGKGEGSFFTRTDWAREQFTRHVGIDPFPGTLNLRLSEPEASSAWHEIKRAGGIHLAAPDPSWCDAWLFPVTLCDRVPAAIVLPDVADYPTDEVELIAGVCLRDTLGVGEGDTVTVSWN